MDGNVIGMVVLRAIIVGLVGLAIGVALIPLLVLLDLRRGGTGWGLCPEGLATCRSTYFAGFELIGWLFLALFVLLGLIAACVRLLRFLERRNTDGLTAP